MAAEQLAPYSDLLDLEAIRILKCERHLRHFVREAWKVVEPETPYVSNWHIDALCDHLEATLDGEIRDLLVTMPPRSMKSLTISVFFPAWAWIRRPHLRFLYASYVQDLSTEHNVLCRRVIESDWYQERWGDRYALQDDDNLKTHFSNTARGERRATAVGARATGFGGDVIVCDDPHNVQQAESGPIRQATVRWWRKSMSTRRNNPATGVRIVVQQRVHEEDVAGDCLATGEYTHLNLPQEYEPTDLVTPIGWRDPRCQPGELLWPERNTPEYVASQKRDLGSMDYAAQHQQRPVPAEGGMFKRHWWRYWQPRGANLPPVPVKLPDGTEDQRYAVEQPAWWDRSAQSWDMTFKETKAGSFVVGLAAATNGPNGYILSTRFRERIDFPGTIAGVRALTAQYPEIAAKLIEEKANGAAVIATLKESIAGLIPVQVDGSKEARAHSTTPHVEAGNWHVPHPAIAPWVTEFIDELASFPTGAHDDYVDAFGQLDRYLMAGAHDVDEYLAYMQRQKAGR